MRVLFVSYPLLPVSDESVGGAEQMLWTLERELHRRGYDTAVAACDGSRVSGRLIPTGPQPSGSDALVERETAHNARVLQAIAEAHNAGAPFDLIHDESGLFWRGAAQQVDKPIVATLHLPFDFYGATGLREAPRNVTFNFVSSAQRESFVAHHPRFRAVAVIPNGIAVERLPLVESKRDYLLWLGRICSEKGTHVAIEVASRAGMRLIIAGQVYPFSYHQQYFEKQIAPRLNDTIRLIERPQFAEKCELLSKALALLVPTLIDETSSLVAMEAMACGTPVVAFRRGAMGEVVQEGETGFLVNSEDEMIAALSRVAEISPNKCRLRVQQNFSADRMATDYEALYARLLARHRSTAA
jgi:glycosyltransferase involved in cell wall biosynthesis